MENASKKISSAEKIALGLLCLSFFVGIWHAFPMLNVIGDEMYYVGGVLRAIQTHTIMPSPNDVPYGTLTYLLSFIPNILFLLIALPFFHFDIASLKVFFIQSPWILYLSIRFLSSVIACGMLFYTYRLLKEQFADIRLRIFLAVLLFSNMITVAVLHTGKMWVLSQFLVLVSFYYLHAAISHDDSKRKINVFLSILFSFLAFANFPLNFFALINLPILVFFFWKDENLRKKIFWYSAFGLLVFVSVTLFNFTGIKNQVLSVFTDYHPVSGNIIAKLDFLHSLSSYFLKLVCLFPLFLIMLLSSVKIKIRNMKLFSISLAYFLTYFLVLAVVANYTLEFHTSLRYLFPLGFFLVFILGSLDLKFKNYFYLIGAISILYGGMTLYYISLPTTYNQAYDWVNSNLAHQDVLIINGVSELQLVKNKQSSLLTLPQYCATKCKSIIELDLNKDFVPTIADLVMSASPASEDDFSGTYYISDYSHAEPELSLVASFTNPSRYFHSIDYNLGSYFDLAFFRIRNLGRDVYIYKKSNNR